MNITPDVYEAHRVLSKCSAAFLDFIRENPSSLERSNYKDVVSNFFGYIKFHPWPTFIDEKAREMFDTAAVEVFKLIASIPERLFAFDQEKIMEYYRYSKNDVKRMMRGIREISLPDLLSRADFIFSPSAGLKCLEYNIVSDIGGGWQADALEPFYFKNPILARFLKEYNAKFSRIGFSESLLNHVLDRALTHSPLGQNDEINVAVVLPKFDTTDKGIVEVISNLKKLYREILKQKAEYLKGEIILTDFSQLDLMSDQVIYNMHGENKKIHVIVEKCNGMVPAPLMNIVERGNVLLFNGPIGQLLSNKLNLALLSEHEDSNLFSIEERETIKKYIPWTRKVTADLEDYIIEHREDLVLKPGDGFGGYGVYLGRNTLHDKWKQFVSIARMDKNWVVQEYIPSYSYLYQEGEYGAVEHYIVWGIFVFGSGECGGVTRVLPVNNNKGVINASQGALFNVILDVAEVYSEREKGIKYS